MNRFDVVQWFIEQCQAATTVDSLSEAFARSTRAIGFRYFACGSHVDPLHPGRAVMLLSYPREWVAVFSELRLQCIDPVFRRADRSVLPFCWDAPDFRRSLTPMQQRILKEAARFGVEHGYTIPIHSPRSGPDGRASCSLVPEGPMHPHSAYAAQLMAAYLFEAAAARNRVADSHEQPSLSPRQRQCLELAAQGKSDWAIARLLNLRETTVHNYIESAKRRFAVATRVQAVVHALASRQISFGDVVRGPPARVRRGRTRTSP